jgi:hypothetical protein
MPALWRERAFACHGSSAAKGSKTEVANYPWDVLNTADAGPGEVALAIVRQLINWLTEEGRTIFYIQRWMVKALVWNSTEN